ncbi:MAG: prohibitin family protein [Elusimicrobia bacterium]|nr:prohibitin family protein [Elusimicrobiota bacterium]
MGFVVLALFLTAAIVMMSRSQWQLGNRVDLGALISLALRYGVGLILLAMLISVTANSLVVIAAGHRGIVFNRLSGIRQKSLGEGFNFVMPLIEQVYQMEVRVQKDSYDAEAASKDLQMVHAKVALNYHPDPEAVPRVFQEVGTQYSERVIQPAIQEAVKATTARFTAEELVTKREEVKRLIRELVDKQISPFNIRVNELYITDFDFSRQYTEAIEAKQIAEQQALKAKRDLDRIRIEAEQKVATARAEADSLRMQKEAITPQLIQLRQVETQKLAIEKWNGQMPSVILGSGATPLLDLSSLSPRFK